MTPWWGRPLESRDACSSDIVSTGTPARFASATRSAVRRFGAGAAPGRATSDRRVARPARSASTAFTVAEAMLGRAGAVAGRGGAGAGVGRVLSSP